MELTSSGHVEWYTPRPYTDSVRAVFGCPIWLDPASSERANEDPVHGIGARYYFTREDDGLTQPWHGRVRLDPFGGTICQCQNQPGVARNAARRSPPTENISTPEELARMGSNLGARRATRSETKSADPAGSALRPLGVKHWLNGDWASVPSAMKLSLLRSITLLRTLGYSAVLTPGAVIACESLLGVSKPGDARTLLRDLDFWLKNAGIVDRIRAEGGSAGALLSTIIDGDSGARPFHSSGQRKIGRLVNWPGDINALIAETRESLPRTISSHLATLIALELSQEIWSRPALDATIPRETDLLMSGATTRALSNISVSISTSCPHSPLCLGFSSPVKVFLNPPYGRRFGKRGPYNMTLWTRRLVDAYEHGEVDEAILLVNAFTGARWFLPLWKYLVCLTDHRIAFVDGRTMEPQPDPKHFNAFVYLGHNRDAFADVFGQWGTIVERFQQRTYHFVISPPAENGGGFGTVNGRVMPAA